MKKLPALAMTGAIVAGSLLSTATPAAAATGRWGGYGNTNPITSSSSSWSCNETRALATSVGAQICAVKAPKGSWFQAAVIVRNNQPSRFYVSADMTMRSLVDGVRGTWTCPSEPVAAKTWSVCFGETLDEYSNTVFVSGHANGRDLGSASNTA
jgi:hypothetical protein